MNTTKRILCALLAVMMTAALGACSSGVTEKDATAFIQGDLDAYYRGVYNQDYLDLVEDVSLSDAKEAHQSNVEAEAAYLMQWLEIEYPTDAVTAKAEAIVEDIYSHADYTVGQASKLQDGGFGIEVKVKPIEIVSLLPDDVYSECYIAVLEEYEVDYENITEEEYIFIDGEYGIKILDELEALMPQLTYGTEQSIMFQISLGEDGYYTLTGTAYNTFDEILIDYSGVYMQ